VKKFSILLVLMLTLSGCTNHTNYGKCVGVMDTEDPAKEYAVSYWNCFLGFIFSETIIVPAVVILTDLKCPVGDVSGVKQ
jgi:hypothetical protein